MTHLFDTDILIDYLRDDSAAVDVVENQSAEAYLSTLTVAELYQGIREGAERTKLHQTLSVFTVLPVTLEIAEQGGLFARDFRKSHGCGLADCLIAATADYYQLKLYTLNGKHYPMLKNVVVPYRKTR